MQWGIQNVCDFVCMCANICLSSLFEGFQPDAKLMRFWRKVSYKNNCWAENKDKNKESELSKRPLLPSSLSSLGKTLKTGQNPEELDTRGD